MNLVNNIRVANTPRTRAIEIVKCGLNDVYAWQKRIQPHIPKDEIGGKWHWPSLHIGCKVIERSSLRKADTYKICVKNSDNELVTVGQVLLSYGYAFPGNSKKKCIFLWFIARAPKEALREAGLDEHFVVLPAVLDLAIQLSKAKGYGGRIGLHAATGTEAQSERLMNTYREIGLSNRTKLSKYFRPPFRKEDGRLFFFDEDGAEAFARAQDHLR